jgi:hypothetical protein
MPQTTLNLPSLRIVVPALQVVYSTAMHAVRMPYTGTGYFIAMPWTIPPDADLTRPISVYFRILTTNGAAVQSTIVHWFSWGRGTNNPPALTFATLVTGFVTPAVWLTNELIRSLLDNGNGWTFDPNTFTPGDLVTFNLRRMGTDPADNYLADTDYPGYLEVVYYRRCQAVCC